jgi:hypothetical protein
MSDSNEEKTTKSTESSTDEAVSIKVKSKNPNMESDEEETKPKVSRTTSTKSEDSTEEETKPKAKKISTKSKDSSSEEETKPKAKKTSTKAESSDKEESKYKELWEKGIEKGLISKDRAPERRFGYMVRKDQLKEQLAAYKAADVKQKKKLAKDFEKNLAERIQKADDNKAEAIKKGTYKKHGSHKKSASHKKGDSKKGSSKKGSYKKGSHKKGGKSSEDSNFGTPLMKLWDEAMEAKFIEEGNQFHRELVDFITFSELKALFKQYGKAEKGEKKEMKSTFNEELKSFNDTAPHVNRFFKVFRPYTDVWKEAIAAKLISKDTEFKPSYAEWLPVKTLVGYISTISSLDLSKDRKAFRDMISPLIMTKLESADKSFEIKTQLTELNNKELIAKLSRENFISEEDVCTADSKCVKKLSKDDIITAFMAWGRLPEAEAESRKVRWNAYLKYMAEK